MPITLIIKLALQQSSQSTAKSSQTHCKRIHKLNTIGLISSSVLMFLKRRYLRTLSDSQHHFATQAPIGVLLANRRLTDSFYIKSWQNMLKKLTPRDTWNSHLKSISKTAYNSLELSLIFWDFWGVFFGGWWVVCVCGRIIIYNASNRRWKQFPPQEFWLAGTKNFCGNSRGSISVANNVNSWHRLQSIYPLKTGD
jgi:hypothetical protein